MHQGVALFSGLRDGEYVVIAREQSSYDREIAVARTTIRADHVARVTLTPFPQAAAMIRVVDAATGEPLAASATVQLSGYAASTLRIRPGSRQRISAPTRHPFKLVIEAEGYAEWSHDFTLEPGEQLRLGVIALERSPVQPGGDSPDAGSDPDEQGGGR